MCGRYSLAEPEFSQLKLELDWRAPWSFVPRYNIAPSREDARAAPILWRESEGKAIRLELARFWFVPSFWTAPLSRLPTCFNARSEDLGKKRFWKARFDSGRCLVPATAWREFPMRGGRKQPISFNERRKLLTFGGLWDRWIGADGSSTVSYAIVTEPASESARAFHDRMPMRVSASERERWLNPCVSGVEALAGVLAAERPEPEHYWSDPWGNSVQHEGPRCIEEAGELQLSLFS